MAKQKLGRGFDALIPKDLDASLLEEDKTRVQKILISDIKPNPDQPRQEFDENSLKDLASSIAKHGVLQPIIVVRSGPGYTIVAGERRWRAAGYAKLSHIPVIIRSLEELEQIELALIENIQRVDLSPLEQALSVYRLQHHFNLTLEQISEKLGKAQSTLSNLSRLLRLPQDAREALRQGKISEGHARAILSLGRYHAKQEELLRSILNNKWNVRQAEQFANQIKKAGSQKNGTASAPVENEVTKSLSTRLGSDVKIRRSGKGGQLIITYKSASELSKIAQAIISSNKQNEQ